MLRHLSLILRNSLRNRRRSILTVSSMAVSLCLLGVLMAMYRALFYGGDTSPAQALRLMTHHKVSLANPLPSSYGAKIEQVPGVKSASVWQWFGGAYKDARDPRNFFARFGVDPARVLAIHAELVLPDEQKQVFLRERTACIASRALADKFGWKPGERITFEGDIFPVTLELTLAGIFDDPDRNELLFFNRDYLEEALPKDSPQRDTVGAFKVQVSSPQQVPAVAKAIDGLFENSPYPTTTESERAFQLSFVSFLGNLKLFLMAICGAVTFTILLVSANTISMSVRERIPEFGIMKALGFTPAAVLGIILGEAAVIGLAGGALGCLLAGGLCAMGRQAPAFLNFLRQLSLTPWITVLSLSAAVLIGLASALIPALNASRTSIVDSLRHAG
jgi:putative ABC transport system permease protein